MPFTDDSGDLLFGPWDGITVLCLHNNTKKRFGVEQGLGAGHRNNDKVIEVNTDGDTGLTENADHPEAAVTDPDNSAERGFLPKKFFNNRGAENADLLGLIGIDIRQKPALVHGKVADLQKRRCGAEHSHLSFSLFMGDRGVAHHNRRHIGKNLGPEQGPGIINGKVAWDRPQQGWDAAGGLHPAGNDDQEVGAETCKPADHIVSCSFPE